MEWITKVPQQGTELRAEMAELRGTLRAEVAELRRDLRSLDAKVDRVFVQLLRHGQRAHPYNWPNQGG